MVTTKTYTFSNVSGNHTITGAFKAMTAVYTLGLDNANFVGKVKLRYKIGSDSWTNITSPTVQGTSVTIPANRIGETLTVEAYDIVTGWKFKGVQMWNGGSQGPYSTDNPLSVTTVSGASVNLDYELEQKTAYTITASAGTHGSISPSGSVTVYEGDSQTFTVTADSGYEIDSILVDGSPIPLRRGEGMRTYDYTFEDVAEAHTISATFKEGGGEDDMVKINVKSNGIWVPLFT